MFLPLPQPIKELRELLSKSAADNFCGDDNLEQLSHLMCNVLEAIALFCDEKVMRSAHRALMMVTSRGQGAVESALGLRSALADVDEALGARWGGFSRLFESALNEGEICLDPLLHLNGFEGQSGVELEEIQAAADRLSLLYDLADSLGVSASEAAGCIVLDCVVNLLNAATKGVVDAEVLLRDWLEFRNTSHRLRVVWCLHVHIRHFSPEVLKELDSNDIECVRAFSLWYLVHGLSENMNIEGFNKKLVKNLLSRANLAPLAVFEMAGLMGKVN